MRDMTPVPPPSRTFTGITEFYRGCVEVTFANFKVIGVVFLALGIPYFIFSWMFLSFVEQRAETIAQSLEFSAELGATIAAYSLITFGAYNLMLVTVASVVAGQMASIKVQPRDCVAWAVRRLPYVIGYEIIVLVVTFLGMLLLVIPGIYLTLRLVAVPFVALFEPSQSPLSRGWALTQDRAMEVFLVFVVMMVLLFAVGIVKTLGGVVASFVPPLRFLVAFAGMFPDWVLPIIVCLLLYGWFRRDLVALEELWEN